MEVFLVRDAMFVFDRKPEVEELLLILPGTRNVKSMRKTIWSAAQRKGIRGVSTTLAWRSDTQTAFWVRRISPLVRLSPYRQAEIFLSVRLSGLNQEQAAARFGVARTTVSSLMARMVQA